MFSVGERVILKENIDVFSDELVLKGTELTITAVRMLVTGDRAYSVKELDYYVYEGELENIAPIDLENE